MEASHLSDQQIANNVQRIEERIRAAAERAGRDPDDVTLVAVTKTFDAHAVDAAAAAGVRVIGENYVQEALAKREASQATGVHWHFIGHLQSNKARFVVGAFDLIHTLDRAKLARELDKRAAAANVERVRCLVEVNVGGERSKAGVAPEALDALLEQVAEYPRIEVRGLMTIPPPGEADETRSCFRTLARLAEGHGLPELSMGMSGDFEVAVEEGATLVRVGTAIFGARK